MIAAAVHAAAFVQFPAAPAAPADPGGNGLCSLPVVGGVCDGVGDVVGGVASSAAQAFVDGFADGFATVVKTMLTFWVDVPTPQISGHDAPVAHLQGLVYWVQGVVLVASLLYVAARTALDRSGKAAGEGVRGLGLMIVWTGAGAAGIDLATAAGDSWSRWIIDQSANGNMPARLAAVSGGSTTMQGLGLGLEFVISLFGIISGLGQMLFLLARVGILTLLVGTLPLMAAGLITPFGKASFQRVIGWIIAFVLYKPAAALVYAGAFTLAGDGKDLTSVLSGFMLIILAVLALPALMRLVAPAVAGAVLASGARQMVSSGSSGSSSGGGGSRPGLSEPGPGSGAGGPDAPRGAVNTGPSGAGSGPGSSSGSGAAGSAAGPRAGGAAPGGGASGGAASGGGSGGAGSGGGAGGGAAGAVVMAGAKAVSTSKSAANNAIGEA